MKCLSLAITKLLMGPNSQNLLRLLVKFALRMRGITYVTRNNIEI